MTVSKNAMGVSLVHQIHAVMVFEVRQVQCDYRQIPRDRKVTRNANRMWDRASRAKLSNVVIGTVSRCCGIAALRYPARWDHWSRAFHGFVAVAARGAVALPAEVRRRLHLDESGAQTNRVRRSRSPSARTAFSSLIQPAGPRRSALVLAGPLERREKEVDEHVAAGRVTVHDDGDAFLGHLDQLDAEARAGESAADAEPQP